MVLSRGATRCLKLLRWYAACYKEVFPYRSTLARQLKVSPQQLDRYIRELKTAGFLKVSQAGPQPSSYQLLTDKNEKAMIKQRESYDKASRRHPYIVSVPQEEYRRRFPMQIETPSPDVVGLLEWAESEGCPMVTGADVIAAEDAYKRRKPAGKAVAEEAYRKAKGSAEGRGGMK